MGGEEAAARCLPSDLAEKEREEEEEEQKKFLLWGQFESGLLCVCVDLGW